MVHRIIEWRGKPKEIRSDNGTEFITKVSSDFCSTSEINHIRIQKGKPVQNGFIERIHRTYIENVLDLYIFESIQQISEKTEEFINDYHNNNPRKSLSIMSPNKFLKSKYQREIPSFTM